MMNSSTAPRHPCLSASMTAAPAGASNAPGARTKNMPRAGGHCAYALVREARGERVCFVVLPLSRYYQYKFTLHRTHFPASVVWVLCGEWRHTPPPPPGPPPPQLVRQLSSLEPLNPRPRETDREV